MAKYTDIVNIIAPSSAAQGERVDVTVKIKNIDIYNHIITCVAIVDSLRFIDEVQLIYAVETNSYSGAFLMAGGNVTIYAYSYYPVGPDWILDDQKTAIVTLEEVKTWILEQTIIGLNVEPVEVETWILEQTITGLSVTPALHQGRIVAKLLDINNIWHNIPLDVELDTETRIKIITRNTGSVTTYRPTCIYEVRDPDGVLAAPRYENTTIDAASPGEETSFFPVFETFILREIGDYTLEVWLYSYESGELLDHWKGRLCTVKEEAPPPPPPCTPGKTKCIGADLYECSPGGEWVLVGENAPECVEEEKKFPWLPVALIGGGVVVAGAALVKPKKKIT